MHKAPVGWWMGLVLIGLLSACARAHRAAEQSPTQIAIESGGGFDNTRSPIGIDYGAEARCSDNNPTWLPGLRPRACAPQLGQKTCGGGLNTCPAKCQQCFDDDLAFIQRNLKVNIITIYEPNYYILKAAQHLKMKVIVGLMNDAVLGLAMPDARTSCSVGGAPLYLCGNKYASAMIDGACIDAAGGDPSAPCISHCAIRSDPPRDCAVRDCSCDADSQCKGASNRCLRGAYIAPLNNAATGEFLRDGTVVALQLGNEFFGQCQIPEVPGQNQPCCARNRQTGACRAWTVNQLVYSTAAQTLRRALDQRGLNDIKITAGLVEQQGLEFCRGGAPPPGIDYIAAHSYCDYIAKTPPSWTITDGPACWEQAREYFAADRNACGAARTYMAESGFNTGCPAMANHEVLLKAERDFVAAMIAAQPACNGQPDPATPYPGFLFEFADAGPPGGCLSGCGDPRRCDPNCCCGHRCSATALCAADCPSCYGNGYFGLYHTPSYRTAGFPPEPKFDPTPSLLCPAAPH